MENLTMWISIAVFLLTYVFIIWDKFDRAVVALSGAFLLLIFNILEQEQALKEIDFNTIGLLAGMMIIVMIIKRTGVFEYIAIRIVKLSKADPFKIVIYLSLATGILSAFLDNVTTILLIIPVTISMAKDLKLNPIPFIIAEVFSSNVGGTATLIGDPPNILIGSAAGISFMDFLRYNGIFILPLLMITVMLLALKYKKQLVAEDEVKQKILLINEKDFIKDKKLLVKCMAVLGLVVAGFLLHGVIHLESSVIALIGAVLLLALSGLKSEEIFMEVEWKTIFFFIGLFVLVGGLKETGVIEIMAQKVFDMTGANAKLATIAILWVSAVASAFVDNIPFVTTMIPLIEDIGKISGMDITPLWWALSLGACLGGNGTIIGASANVVAVGLAEEQGIKITFGKFFKEAFLLMLLSILLSTAYLWIVFF